MSKFNLFKKNFEINNYKKLLSMIYGTDLTCSLDIKPVLNPIWFAEYV
jgi:hypothetical protein